MRIKTITCHDVYNYGASLQAYALQTFLECQGNEVKIIDYLPSYKAKRYDWFTIPEGSHLRVFAHIPLVNKICGLLCHRHDFKYLKRYLRFNAFKQRYLHCTALAYKSIDDLKANCPQADLYVAGSDQIWNTKYINGTDPSYYCDFVNDSNKCISYAASFATSELDLKWTDFVRKELGNFRALSVREATGVHIAEALGYKATAVMDPVFLLDKKNWEALCKRPKKEKYLIVYDFLRNDSRIKEICQKIAKDKGLAIYSLNDGGKTEWADKNIYNAGPIEFLEWIRDAEFVVSTSFHATAFSVIFERQFLTFPLIGHGNSSRMSDFLRNLGLHNRFFDGKLKDERPSIDYRPVNAKRKLLQENSRGWLLKQLQYYKIEN